MPLFAKGFRPFFLLGGAFAAIIVPLWLVVLGGGFVPRGPLTGVAWHAHEMIFGFTTAIIAGFLLTAVGTWTGRTTAVGGPLAALAGVWCAGRIALVAVPGWPASAIDLSFLPILAGVLAWPLWQKGDRVNAGFPAVLGVLAGANLVVHLDALGVLTGRAIPAERLSVHLIVVIVLVITGRTVPMFTRNATGAEVYGSPRFDAVAIASTAVLAVLQVVPAAAQVASVVAGIGAIAVVGRAIGWGVHHTARNPILWVVHVGHAWIAVGLALEAAVPWTSIGASPALHALTVGAIGTLTLGMMARVALGHTGRPIHAPPAVAVGFALVPMAALVRVIGPIVAPGRLIDWLWVAGLLWAVAFALYAATYLPILTRPRVDGKPG